MFELLHKVLRRLNVLPFHVSEDIGRSEVASFRYTQAKLGKVEGTHYSCQLYLTAMFDFFDFLSFLA